jgi:hypothetical protein
MEHEDDSSGWTVAAQLKEETGEATLSWLSALALSSRGCKPARTGTHQPLYGDCFLRLVFASNILPSLSSQSFRRTNIGPRRLEKHCGEKAVCGSEATICAAETPGVNMMCTAYVEGAVYMAGTCSLARSVGASAHSVATKRWERLL